MCLCVALVALYCSREKHVESSPRPALALGDSVCTAAEIDLWHGITVTLDSLSIVYADSFSDDSDSDLGRAQRRFARLQDSICIHAGLPGGYRTYDSLCRHVARYGPPLDSLERRYFRAAQQ
jgi:hypothetical protein